jgi:adenylate cyclase
MSGSGFVKRDGNIDMLLRVLTDQCLMFEGEINGAVVLGRQEAETDPLYTPASAPNQPALRLNIAGIREQSISRKCLQIEPLAPGRVRVTNLGQRTLPSVNGGEPIGLGASLELAVPVILTVLNKMIRIDAEDQADADLQSLSEPTILPGSMPAGSKSILARGLPAIGQSAALLDWFRTVSAVLQSAAGSDDFFQKAAEALVDLVGLSYGRVLLYQDGQWHPVAIALHEEASGSPDKSPPSRRILANLLKERRTFWQSSSTDDASASLANVQTVVAAPILDKSGQVLGALYGDRRGFSLAGRTFSQLEAVLAETLACSVATGLARVEQQRAAMAAQVRFEQFFTPELSRYLSAQPDLLRGRDAEVTLLFCDVRGFSRISERLGPAATLEWMGSVIGALSDCVSAHNGVLVDYIGDEIMAMWGAPAVQPNHAQLACRAACDMLETVRGLNAEWKHRIHDTTQIGIGINTGRAHVGNTGSQRKFKYGPLGTPVNLASRVQGATKFLRTDLLVTGNTRKQLTDVSRARRLCQVRVVNISEPVDLYQLPVGAPTGWDKLCAEYEKALEEFERQNFRSAAGILSRLICEDPDDGPAMALLARTVDCLMKASPDFTPVWDLPGK